MRFSLLKATYLAVALSLLEPAVFAQTANIGYFDAGGVGGTSKGKFTTGTYSGSGDGFIDSGDLNGGYTGATHTGQTGDAIIVTPISDPVIHFNSYLLTNTGPDPITSVTFRLPQYLATDPNYNKLGFLDTGGTTFGIGSLGSFVVQFEDPITGTYNGDASAYLGLPMYSTIHFWGGVIGTPFEGVFQQGQFSFYAAYPATNGQTSFMMDAVPGYGTPSSTPNTTFFNTAGNPAGGIVPVAVTPELPGAALFVPALLPVALLARRRRRS